jgi:hypothetical protein
VSSHDPAGDVRFAKLEQIARSRILATRPDLLTDPRLRAWVMTMPIDTLTLLIAKLPREQRN